MGAEAERKPSTIERRDALREAIARIVQDLERLERHADPAKTLRVQVEVVNVVDQFASAHSAMFNEVQVALRKLSEETGSTLSKSERDSEEVLAR